MSPAPNSFNRRRPHTPAAGIGTSARLPAASLCDGRDAFAAFASQGNSGREMLGLSFSAHAPSGL